jgi:uncharacterized protein YacL
MYLPSHGEGVFVNRTTGVFLVDMIQFGVMKKIQKTVNVTPKPQSGVPEGGHVPVSGTVKPTAEFTKTLAREIVKNLVAFGQLTTRPFHREDKDGAKGVLVSTYVDPVYVDTSVLIDSRIAMIVASGFFAGTLVIPQFVLAELQHIADSADLLRRTKGRLGLDVVNKLKGQRANERVTVKISNQDPVDIKEVDHKLVDIAKKQKARLLTVDFNLAQLARAQGVKVLNINDLAQAIKISLIPSEEITVKISHAGKEREQGVAYLDDGTMIVVDDAKTRVGQDMAVVITKIHQTPAGQLFFARPK